MHQAGERPADERQESERQESERQAAAVTKLLTAAPSWMARLLTAVLLQHTPERACQMIVALAWYYQTLNPLLGPESFALFGVQGQLLINGDSGISVLRNMSLVEELIERNGPFLSDFDESKRSSQQPVDASAAEQVDQPLPNRWDRLPRELQLRILRFAGPLTQFLCGDKPTLAERKSANGNFNTLVWCDAFKLEWQGDLARLPSYFQDPFRSHTPRPHRQYDFFFHENSMDYVQTRSMYKRLCLVESVRYQFYLYKDQDRSANVYGDEAVVNGNAAAGNGDQPALNATVDGLDDQLQQGVEALQINHEDGPAPVDNPGDDPMPVDNNEQQPNEQQPNEQQPNEQPEETPLKHTMDEYRLIHIPMRHCWFDLLDFDLSINMARAAIEFGYTDLLRHLIFERKSVDVRRLRLIHGYIDDQYSNHNRNVLVMDYAVYCGHFDVLKLLHEAGSDACSDNAMDWAAMGGRLDMLEWLWDNTQLECTEWAIVWAAEGGFLDVVIWLHDQGYQGTDEAMDRAAGCGRMAVVQWLHEYGYGCTTRAMDWALQYGHYDMVKWLHANRQEGCTSRGWDTLGYKRLDGLLQEPLSPQESKDGLEMLEWLHKNRDEGCTTLAMDLAARLGDLPRVKWLHEHGYGCTTDAMDYAASRGQLDVVVWLHENRTEGCTTKALDGVLGRLSDPRFMEVAEWLLAHRQEGFTRKAIDDAFAHRSAKAIRFLLKNCLDRLTVHDLARLGFSFIGTLTRLPATQRTAIQMKCLEAMTDAYASIADPSVPPLDESVAKIPDLGRVHWR